MLPPWILIKAAVADPYYVNQRTLGPRCEFWVILFWVWFNSQAPKWLQIAAGLLAVYVLEWMMWQYNWDTIRINFIEYPNFYPGYRGRIFA